MSCMCVLDQLVWDSISEYESSSDCRHQILSHVLITDSTECLNSSLLIDNQGLIFFFSVLSGRQFCLSFHNSGYLFVERIQDNNTDRNKYFPCDLNQ